MAKGFKFPAPKGFAKGGMCSPKGAKGYAKGGYAKGGTARGTNMEASDMYDPSDLRTLEAGQNVPRENKNRMRSESVQNAKAKADLKKNYDDMYSFNPKRMMDSDVGGAYTRMRATEDQTGEYAKGGKVKKYANGGVATGPSRTSPPPRPVPGPVTGTAISPTPPRPVTGSPQPRPPIAPVVAPLSAAAQRRSTGLPPPKPVPGPVSGTPNTVNIAVPKLPGNTLAGAGRFAKGGKVAMKKMKSGRTFAKINKGYADGGEVETEQTASKSTKVKMPRGAKAPVGRTKAVPVAPRQPMIQPQVAAPMPGVGMRGPAPSPLARVANAAPRMGMKMGGKAKKC